MVGGGISRRHGVQMFRLGDVNFHFSLPFLVSACGRRRRWRDLSGSAVSLVLDPASTVESCGPRVGVQLSRTISLINSPLIPHGRSPFQMPTFPANTTSGTSEQMRTNSQVMPQLLELIELASYVPRSAHRLHFACGTAHYCHLDVLLKSEFAGAGFQFCDQSHFGGRLVEEKLWLKF